MTEERGYPLEIRGELSFPPNRGLWLIKWLLAIPHWIILFFLGIGAFVVWFIAWWAALFTARYPRWMFNYITGVMRWQWRVSFYAGVLGTDRYPPFGFASDDDYPADLYVEHPERLSRVKVIFKWWLLAIPHYIIVYFFGGAGVRRFHHHRHRAAVHREISRRPVRRADGNQSLEMARQRVHVFPVRRLPAVRVRHLNGIDRMGMIFYIPSPPS